eukprot:14166558-Alexandrium_andersonii.AAC.1
MSPAQAAPELGAHARLRHLRRERHIHVLIHVGEQVRLSRVGEESVPSPAAAARNLAPPTGRQARQEEPECLQRGAWQRT